MLHNNNIPEEAGTLLWNLCPQTVDEAITLIPALAK